MMLMRAYGCNLFVSFFLCHCIMELLVAFSQMLPRAAFFTRHIHIHSIHICIHCAHKHRHQLSLLTAAQRTPERDWVRNEEETNRKLHAAPLSPVRALSPGPLPANCTDVSARVESARNVLVFTVVLPLICMHSPKRTRSSQPHPPRPSSSITCMHIIRMMVMVVHAFI